MITLYSTPTCAPCKQIKSWLEQRGLEYTMGDLDEMVLKTGVMYVPVVDWDGEIITGFNPKRLNEIYNKKNPKG